MKTEIELPLKITFHICVSHDGIIVAFSRNMSGYGIAVGLFFAKPFRLVNGGYLVA